MLIFRHTSGQNFRDHCIGDGWETEVDRAGRSSVFQVIDLTQRQHKSEHTLTVIEQDISPLPAFQAAKGQSRTDRKTQGVDGADRIGAEGHGIGIIAQLDAFFGELVDDTATIDITG